MDTTIQKIELLYVSGSAPALSLSTDEGGTLLSGHSMKSETRAALLGTLTKLYDGSGVVRDRVGEGQSGFRFNVRFGVFLSAQPVVLADALNDSLLLDQGFLARFLYTAPTSLAGTRLLEKSTLESSADKDSRIIAYWNNLELMCRLDVNVDEYGGLVLPMVGMDEEAIGVWLDFYNETELQQRVGGEYAHLKAFASRAGELAVRVAAVYAAWNCAENEVEMKEACVTADDMRRAVALVKFSLDEWLRHSEGTVLNPTELDARDLLEMLHRREWATATRKLIGQSGPNALRNKPARRKAAIDELVNRGWLIDENGEFTVVQKPTE